MLAARACHLPSNSGPLEIEIENRESKIENSSLSCSLPLDSRASHDQGRRIAAVPLEAVLWLHVIPPVSGGNHLGGVGRQGCFCLAPNGRREVALFPTAGAGLARLDGRGLALDRADERSG